MGCTESIETIPGALQASLTAPHETKTLPVIGNASIMDKKGHGTSQTPVQDNLRWGCDFKTADKICNYNRHYAEFSGYFKARKIFLKELDNAKATSTTMKFYDSNTGNLLFEAPVGRSHDEFLAESVAHGWPSFRDEEVNWDQVRCLRGGEAISLAGTHLGHNLPDKKGNRYCINLVSCAGNPVQECSAAPTPAE